MRRGRGSGGGGVETGEAELGPYLIGIQRQSPSAGRHSCRRRRAGRRCGVGGWGRLHSSAESKSWVVPPYTLSPPSLKGHFVVAKRKQTKKELQMTSSTTGWHVEFRECLCSLLQRCPGSGLACSQRSKAFLFVLDYPSCRCFTFMSK